MTSPPSLGILGRCWSGYVYALQQLTRSLAIALGSLGALTARRPRLVFLTALSVALLCSLGWLRMETENEGDELWVPQDTVVMDNRDYVDRNFPSSDVFVEIIVEAKESRDGNALALDVTYDIFGVQDDMFAIETSWEGKYRRDPATEEEFDWSGGPVRYEDICLRDSAGRCQMTAYLEFWNSTRTTYLTSVGATDGQAGSGNRTQLIVDANVETYPTGGEVVQERVFGGDRQLDAEGRIVSSRVVRHMWMLDKNVEDGLLEDWSKELEDFFLDAANVYSTANANARVYMMHPYSVDNAISESVNGDILPLVVAITIICTVSVIVLSHRSWVRTRSTLATGGVATVGLSILAGYGVLMGVGVPFTSLQGVLPFILLGIGVDDMFVLVRALEEVDLKHPGLPEEARFRKTLETGGVSITVTSLTDLAAFMLGSFTSIPAIRWFCWYAGVSILLDFFLQVTLFMSLFVWTERRIAANRADYLCCIRCEDAETSLPSMSASATDAEAIKAEPAALKPPPPLPPADASDPEAGPSGPPRNLFPFDPRTPANETPSIELTPPAAKLATHRDPEAQTPVVKAPTPQARRPRNARADRSWAQVFLDDYYMPVLLHPAVKVVSLLLFAALLTTGILGINNLKEGLELSQLAPDDHYLIDFDNIADETFEADGGVATGLYFRGVDASDPAVQNRFLQVRQYVLDEGEYMDEESSPKRTWLSELVAHIESNAGTCSTADLRNGTITARSDDGTETQVAVTTVASENFYVCLDEFLSTENGLFYLDSLSFTRVPGACNDSALGVDRRGCLKAVTFTLQHTPKRGRRSYERKLMNEKDDLVDETNSKFFAEENKSTSEDVVFIYMPAYVFWQQDQVMFRELMQNLGLALLGITIINMVLLVQPGAVALMVLAIVVVDAGLFAWMWALGIALNSVSVVNMVMAVGLAVDYSVHITHKFLTKDGTRQERIKAAMGEMGAAVLIGALTSMLGVLPLAASNSYIFRTFFRLLFATILLGILVGFILVPTMLSLVGPAKCIEEDTEQDVRAPPQRSALPQPVAEGVLTRISPMGVLPPINADRLAQGEAQV